jgi:hypothetical protein
LNRFNDTVSLRLHLRNEVPPGGFRYTERETGRLIQSPSWNDLISDVKKHRIANNIPIGLEFEKEVEEQLCQILPAGSCIRDNDSKDSFGPVTLEQFKRGSATLFEWWSSGRQTVDDGTAEARTKICASCQFNQKVANCASCSLGFLHTLVERIFGNKRIKGFELLHGCQICGCANKVAVAIPLDILQRNMPDDLNSKLPSFCWKKKL